MTGTRIFASGLVAAVLVFCAGCTAEEGLALAGNGTTHAAAAPGTPPADDNAFPPPSPPSDLPRVDPISGHLLTPIGSGAYTDPFTGTLYGPAGSGTIVNTQTGALIPG